MIPSRITTDTAMDVLAWGRIALGAASLAAPTRLCRAAGVSPTAETGYLTRIYGARAVALGAAYLLGSPGSRHTLHRLSLGVDLSDTLTGTGHLLRRDSDQRAMTALTVLTGTYAAIGATRAVATRRVP